MREVNQMRGSLSLSRSSVVEGAELYEGNLVEKFNTGWHLQRTTDEKSTQGGWSGSNPSRLIGQLYG
jgi:hypothetical protein